MKLSNIAEMIGIIVLFCLSICLIYGRFIDNTYFLVIFGVSIILFVMFHTHNVTLKYQNTCTCKKEGKKGMAINCGYYQDGKCYLKEK